jgi:hypothetical protein
MAEDRSNRFEQFDPAEVLILQHALVLYKGRLEGENYSMLVSRLVGEAAEAPSLDQAYVPGGREDLEAVLRNLGVHDAEIEGTRNWPLADVEALVMRTVEEDE